MTGPEDGAIAALTTLIASTWPALTGVWRSEQLGRADWENLVLDGSLTVPFCVLRLGPSRPEGWALDAPTFRFEVTVIAVVALGDTNAANDVTAFLLQQLGALRSALIAYAGGGFQLGGELPQLNASLTSEANRTLLGQLVGYQAAELTAPLLVG